MAFYYFVNPAVNTFSGMDQLQSYFSSFASAYHNSSEVLNGSLYGWNMPLGELLSQPECMLTSPTTMGSEEGQTLTVASSEGAPKKRRV
jgi:hypothetical protein